MNEKIILTTTHNTWYGPYASEEDAREAQKRIRKDGNSLGIKETTKLARAIFWEDLKGRITIEVR